MDNKFVPAVSRFSKDTLRFVLAAVASPVRAQSVSVDPEKMARIAALDQRFASNNIEMPEVAGGILRKLHHRTRRQQMPTGMNPNTYQSRPPINRSNPVFESFEPTSNTYLTTANPGNIDCQ